MNLRVFLKSLSIYGILPVFTKFASFLLVPVYVRVFSSIEFGIVELITSSVNFVIFAMNLEFYAAVGRFFFERDNLSRKRKLISSGLIMTITASMVVVIICFSLRKQIGQLLFQNQHYSSEISVGLLWAVFAAVSTYLSVLPRYLKKAKQYVLYNAISLLTKLFSTIVYVVVMKMGVMGAVLGNLTGAITSTVLYANISNIYLRPVILKNDIMEILRFSLPLVPGLLALGIYQPAMRTVLSRVYSLHDLGLFSFSVRMVSIMAIVEHSIKLSWKPMLYENLNKPSFGNEYYKISRFVGKVLLSTGIIISVLSPELIRVIGTEEYHDSAKLVGFLIIWSILRNLTMLRGFGFEVTKKTHVLSWISISTSVVGLVFMKFISPSFGFIGIGIAFMIPSVLSYAVMFIYTNKVIQSEARYSGEMLFWMLLICSTILVVLDVSFAYRVSIVILLIMFVEPWVNLRKIRKNFRSGLN